MLKLYDLKIKTAKDVYEPAEDTFLLVDSLDIRKGETVLEVGCGAGLAAMVAAKTARSVVATDVNKKAVELASKNAELNGIKNLRSIKGDLFEPIKKRRFDVIIFNAPYLPTERNDKTPSPLRNAWDGGSSGRSTTDQFLAQAPAHLKPGGRIFLVDSSLSDYKKSIQVLELMGIYAKIVASKKFDFEEIVVIRARR